MRVHPRVVQRTRSWDCYISWPNHRNAVEVHAVSFLESARRDRAAGSERPTSADSQMKVIRVKDLSSSGRELSGCRFETSCVRVSDASQGRLCDAAEHRKVN